MERLGVFRLPVFVLLSLIFFYPSYKYGYVTDFLSWLAKYEEGSWADLKDCFDYPGLHHFFHLINFSCFKLVGKSFFGWYIILSVLQGINGFLVYQWVRTFNFSFKLNYSSYFPLFVALCFMLSPYSIEPVVWKACLHYLMSFGLIVFGLTLLTKHLEKGASIWPVHLCFVLALLTLEISLAVPFIYMIYWIAWIYTNDRVASWKQFFLSVSLPQYLIIVIYFLANKYVLGDWVGHYGAESHLNFDLQLMSENGFKYLGKYMFFLHYLPYKIKTLVYGIIANPIVIAALFVVSLSIGWYIRIKYIKGDRSLPSLAFSYLAFFMGLFPISNLFFFQTQIYENDRYGYLASMFIYLFLGLLFWRIRHVWIRIGVVALFCGVLSLCSFKTMKMAHAAGEITHALVDNFSYYDKEKIVMLSKYDNYGGLQMFRDLSGKAQSFTESLYHFEGKKYEGKIYDIAQINFVNWTNKVEVVQLSPNKLKVKNLNPGSWWWKDGMGLENFEDENFKLERSTWAYELTFKQAPEEFTILYNDGLQWKEFRFDSNSKE